MLDKIGNSMGIVPVHLSRNSMVKDSISTGSLVCDLIIGGGWPLGRWVALFGPEASGKSSLLYHTLRDAIRKNVNVEFFDFEGSSDPLYLSKILEMNLNNVFGLRKPGGTWEITPQCRYHQPDLGETYFRYMHRILKELPDKLSHDNRWFYVYDKKPAKESFDKKLYRATKRYWVEADDSGAQVIWFIDSLPAMLPEKRDEKDESKEIGLQARMFSQYIPLVKSRLARKRCSIIAVNQTRLKPMAFGNPEYEVGGEAPKFYSDIRLQCRSCSNIYGKGQVVEEPCWDGIGVDKYRYIKIATRKNKCFSPFRNSVMRIWMEEKGDIGRGLDPVFDTYQYLIETGQIDEKSHGKKMVIKLEGLWTQRMWSWQEFKELILNPNKVEVYEKYELNDPEIGKISEDKVKDLTNVNYNVEEDLKKDVSKTLEEVEKILEDKLNLRERCKEQIRNDTAFELYFRAISGIDGTSAKEPEKLCGNCAHFHKSEECMLVDDDTEGCDQWMSEEEEEEMLEEEE